MIKVYKIKVGEKVYEVEVESVTQKEGEIIATKKTETIAQAAPVPPSNGTGEKIESPMQGLVVSVDVNIGDKVSSGDTLLVIEAMKMENPIVSHVDGIVTSIEVSKGDQVDGGQVLVTIA